MSRTSSFKRSESRRERAAVHVLHLSDGIFHRICDDSSQGPILSPVDGIAKAFDQRSWKEDSYALFPGRQRVPVRFRSPLYRCDGGRFRVYVLEAVTVARDVCVLCHAVNAAPICDALWA